MSDPIRLAVFISPHGYGHAARAAAVMSAIHRIDPTVRFDIFTTVPQWFFSESLSDSYRYFTVLTDVGLVQTTPFAQDVPGTVGELNRFLPFDPHLVRDLSKKIRSRSCRMVLCDISPLGIAVAREADVPSVLIENFTWDWIYEYYADTHPGIRPHVDYLRTMFTGADFHVQTEPICKVGSADLQTGPVSRNRRTSTRDVRRRLAISDDESIVTITLGGIRWAYDLRGLFRKLDSATVIIPGAAEKTTIDGNLRLLPHHSGFYHPDLILSLIHI